MSAVRLPAGKDSWGALTDLLARSLEEKRLDAVMIPVKGTDGRSWPWILACEPDRLANAVPVPPVMQVQGARALRSLAGATEGRRIAAVLRPCEYRAAVELAKLQQLDLSGTVVFGVDCPGSAMLRDIRSDRAPGTDLPLSPRPVCEMCTEFIGAGDVRVIRSPDGSLLLDPLTDKGKQFVDAAALSPSKSDTGPGQEALARAGRAAEAREEFFAELSRDAGGLEGLEKLFSACIGCRNCRDVCPVCYCRLCFIDSKDQRLPASRHLQRSRSAGAARLTPGTLLFHIGRMAHVSLSCTGCGMCEDACPSAIPVARLMAMVSEKTGALFGYSSGSDPSDPTPLGTFEEEELGEFED